LIFPFDFAKAKVAVPFASSFFLHHSVPPPSDALLRNTGDGGASSFGRLASLHRRARSEKEEVPPPSDALLRNTGVRAARRRRCKKKVFYPLFVPLGFCSASEAIPGLDREAEVSIVYAIPSISVKKGSSNSSALLRKAVNDNPKQRQYRLILTPWGDSNKFYK
jgi:hypothetical protein